MKVLILMLALVALVALAGCEYVMDTSVQVNEAQIAVRDVSTLEQFSGSLEPLGFVCDDAADCDEFCVSRWEDDFTSEADRELLRQAEQMTLCWWKETSGTVIKTHGQIRAAAFATSGHLTIFEVTDKYLGP